MRVDYPVARGRSRAYWMIAFHVGPAGKSRRLTRWLHYPDHSLQQVVAARDQLCFYEILRLRRERIAQGHARPDLQYLGNLGRYHRWRVGRPGTTGSARATARPWRSLALTQHALRMTTAAARRAPGQTPRNIATRPSRR